MKIDKYKKADKLLQKINSIQSSLDFFILEQKRSENPDGVNFTFIQSNGLYSSIYLDNETISIIKRKLSDKITKLQKEFDKL